MLSSHVNLGKQRLETLCLLITGMIGARTVNLSHLASERHGEVLVASTYRRLQRFFQHVRLGEDWAARLIVGLIHVPGPWCLCLDRTNWKIGANEVNILMLAIVTRRFRLPLMWTVLDREGSSHSEDRIALMRRYLALFGVGTVRLLLADREFIGLKWLTFLDDSGIPFAIRVREGQYVRTDDGRCLRLVSLMRRYRGKRTFKAAFEAMHGDGRIELFFSARRIRSGELLVVASNLETGNQLNAYRKRWGIECLFGDTKTRGFNMEDTRLTIAVKLSLLIAIVALAIAWACRTASKLLGRKNPPRKRHGYYAKSWFRIGFDELRRRLRSDPETAIEIWLKLSTTKRVV
jgi:hypothetical protein